MVFLKVDIKFVFFALSILSYGLFSLPFPRNPGLIEGAVALFLIATVGLRGALNLVAFNSNEGGVLKYRYVFWFLLLTPTIMMFFNNWGLKTYIRDIIPLLYIFLPLFLLPIFHGYKFFRYLPWLVAIVGVLFSLRFFLETSSSPLDIGSAVFWDNKKYFSYDPAVLFGAIWLFVNGLRHLIRTYASAFLSLLCFTGSFLCVAALAGVVQRAPLALFALSCVIYFLFSDIRKDYKVVFLAIMLYLTMTYFSGLFFDVTELFYQKQSEQGLNNKDAEFASVLGVLSLGLTEAMFGIGWGGGFVNPAYGNILMYNTHSVVSYMLIKAGFLGAVAMSVYYYGAIRSIICVFKYDLGLALSASSAFLIGLLFQPTYKTLSYGLILVIVFAYRVDKYNR